MSNPSLVEALKKKFGKVKVHGEWISIPCPTCAPKDRKKMKRYLSTNAYTSSCFICGIKQDVAFLLDSVDYIPTHVTTEYEEEDKGVDPRALVLPYYKAIPVNQLPASHPAIKFFHKDHLTDLDRYANINKIVYVPFEGGIVLHNGLKFITSAERIVFPVFHESKLVGWQMRSTPGTFYGDLEDDVRYYHLFNKGSYLYNYDEVKRNNKQRVIVVEGVKKALKFPNAVATWGCNLSRKQLKLIQEWPEVIMLLDSDEGNNTQQRAKGFVEGINAGGSSRAINIDLKVYGVSSPDDLPSDVLQQIVDQEWIMQHEQTHNKHR